MIMKISDVIGYLEHLAPRSSQESYDNSGLLIGDRNAHVRGVLVTLDCTEEIVNEAVRSGCNLIVAHHPIIFKGLRSITGDNYVERTVLACVKNDVALYAIHTNLDNYRFGVNYEIGNRMGLKDLRILSPKANTLFKLSVFVTNEYHEAVSKAVFEAGAGEIGNYGECEFYTEGTGTFKPLEGADPFSGQIGSLSKDSEIKAEYLVSSHRLKAVIRAMEKAHPYEEVAHDIIPLVNKDQTEGSGMIGTLENEMDEVEFLAHLKNVFKCGAIRHTATLGKKVRTVAFCGGSGSFLLSNAKAAGADVFVTGDFKYHEFFDAEGEIMIADIGHYESEQYTSNLLADILKKKFTTFAVRLTGINTNPINYF
jgi:dinuclear metal center YbgI/SA1388 family protein